MKKHLNILAIAMLVTIASCKKDSNSTATSTVPPPAQDNYSSMNDFFAKNGVPMQTYSVNATTGGSFTTPQGTNVSIPAGSFAPVTGELNIEFKDVYKKSDMLLSFLSTDYYGQPLKSGGMFFMKATSGDSSIQLFPYKHIIVQQPLGGLTADPAMQPFAGFPNPQNIVWVPANYDSLHTYDTLAIAADNYIFSLYSFNYPLDSGTWCNSDNKTYFSAYPKTVLTLNPTDKPDTFQTVVFLVFKNLDCMIHVYLNGNNFPYNYAPQGLQCSVVAVGEKEGALYSSFTPITIGSNQTVNFTLSLTTTAAFVTALRALD